ncbi:transposase [Streptomyces sp. NBC_01619]|uniref:transposase n=1 Tax=Streptomyces sp. NBC_01619 TaxID=2975901 RepID=UPI00225152F2|nr:transposase [Streptomyces sp. NBC_01619]MCX4515810.1 transposase [Streptomyces sp. NBC_01619]
MVGIRSEVIVPIATLFAAYASSKGQALVVRELYIPRSWTEDGDRCRSAKVPADRAFATKPELAHTMVQRALAVRAADRLGHRGRGLRTGVAFPRRTGRGGVGYVLAVPKSQQVKYHVGSWRIDHLLAGAPDEAWDGAA